MKLKEKGYVDPLGDVCSKCGKLATKKELKTKKSKCCKKPVISLEDYSMQFYDGK